MKDIPCRMPISCHVIWVCVCVCIVKWQVLWQCLSFTVHNWGYHTMQHTRIVHRPMCFLLCGFHPSTTSRSGGNHRDRGPMFSDRTYLFPTLFENLQTLADASAVAEAVLTRYRGEEPTAVRYRNRPSSPTRGRTSLQFCSGKERRT